MAYFDVKVFNNHPFTPKALFSFSVSTSGVRSWRRKEERVNEVEH